MVNGNQEITTEERRCIESHPDFDYTLKAVYAKRARDAQQRLFNKQIELQETRQKLSNIKKVSNYLVTALGLTGIALVLVVGLTL